MEPKKTMNKSGYQNSFNPHVKNRKNEQNKNSKDKNREGLELQQQTKKIITKESLAKDLIQNGFIDSFTDFFYVAWAKIPNVKAKYMQMAQNIGEDGIQEENLQTKSKEEEAEDKQKKNNEIIPRHSYDIRTLEIFCKILKQGETAIFEAEINHKISFYEIAIQRYTDIRNETLNDPGVPLEAIYFNQKCIRIATKFKLTKLLISSLKYMGDCFDKMNNAEDMNISKALKEKARDIYFEEMNDKGCPDYPTEELIYNSLRDLYSKLANQQEKMKNYSKAIAILNKLLDVLNSQMSIAKHLKDGGNNEDNENKRIESYLKIANLYFMDKDYDNTLVALGKINEGKNQDENAQSRLNDGNLTQFQIQELYRYAQTYEMQGNLSNAIEYLKKISIADAGQTNDDTLLAKSFLHLGRLYFKQGVFALSNKYLQQFLKKSKTLDTKELMDIARVNLGMIKGSEGKEDFINKMTTYDYDQFLKWKLNLYPE